MPTRRSPSITGARRMRRSVISAIFLTVVSGPTTITGDVITSRTSVSRRCVPRPRSDEGVALGEDALDPVGIGSGDQDRADVGIDHRLHG
jgi:hypothetical protein